MELEVQEMTQTVKLLNTKGSELGELKLDENVFGVEPNIHVMHLALDRKSTRLNSSH